jgi:hypothetical protein
MPTFDASWVDHGSTLSVECFLIEGWRKIASKGTYGFLETQWLDFIGDRRIWLQVGVYPHPKGFDTRTQSFPDLLANEWTNGKYGFSLRDRKLTVRVKVRSDDNEANEVDDIYHEGLSEEERVAKLIAYRDRLLKQLELGVQGRARVEKCTNGNLRFVWVEPKIAAFNLLSFEMVVFVVLQSPRGKAPPISRDWERRFFPGGLPSLGKKR